MKDIKENQPQQINTPVTGNIQGVTGKNIYVYQSLKQAARSNLNYTTTLNSFFDRLFSYLNELAHTDEVPYFELKLKRIMDILGEEVFRGHLDREGQKGFVIAGELDAYMKDSAFVFRDLRATEEELQAFSRFALQVASLELDESNVKLTKIKYAFLLAQLE